MSLFFVRKNKLDISPSVCVGLRLCTCKARTIHDNYIGGDKVELFTPVDVLGTAKKKGAPKAKKDISELPKRGGDSEVANRFIEMLDKWHGHKEVWDDELDAQIHYWEYEIRTTNKKRLPWGKKGTKYFTPSSTNSDGRELYMKHSGAARDQHTGRPHQGRWTRMGTAFGDMVQRDLLFIEKHWKREFGEDPPFVPYYVEVNGKRYPAWEKFSQTIEHVEHNGQIVSILGQCDGILVDTKTGELVLLEVKSKQTTSAQTGFYSMKEVGEDHKMQSITYSMLFKNMHISRGIVLYGNLSKKAWIMSEEDYVANPDIRAFEIKFDRETQTQILDKFKHVLDCVENNKPPKFDITKFTFNSYKEATVSSLTAEEYAEIGEQVKRISRSRMPQWKKNSVLEAWRYIEGNWKGDDAQCDADF